MYHSKRLLSSLTVAAMIVCSSTYAQSNDESVRVGLVQSSQCEVVAKSGSMTGSAVGSIAGVAIGGWLGRELLGGRAGQNLGAVVGGLGGSAVGENAAASRTYNCLVQVSVPGHTIPIYVAVVRAQPVNVGQSVILVKDVNGNWLGR